MTLHALDATELGYLRNGTHWSKPGLVFPDSPTVFKALVNQTISTRDKISDITYDTVTLGAKEDILPGMTLLVGTTEGGYDVGLCRIRKAASATKLFIGTTSEIYWADNLYLTVIKDYNIWAKRAYLNKSGSVLYMDKDVAYSDQHADWLPFVNMGGDRVVRLTGATLDVVLDASASWVQGSTITGYAWTTSAGTLADEDTATPTLTVTAAGTYYLDCTVTADNGKSATGHRTINVLTAAAPEVTEFELTSSPSWAYERGGWEFSVRMWGQANISSVRDRQKVILFARDFYNGSEVSIGQVTGCENIIAVGWIDGETIEPAPDGSSVSFDVRGLHYWLNIETASLMDLDNVGTATAAKWTEIKAMTTDLALCHLLQWRTTINASCDVIQLTGDTRQADAYHEQAVTLWEQISNVAGRILAAPLTDAHNRFCVDIDPQYIPVADRGSLTTIMAVTKPDWRALSLPRVTVQTVGTLHMIGERYITDTDAIQNYYSIANGHSAKRFGADEQGGTVLASGQSQLNTLCGLGMAIRNNPWPAIDIDLAESNRGITGAPAQYISLAVAAGDTPRNVAFSGNIIPRSITHEWDAENNCFLTSISGDAAVTPENAIKEIIPAETPPPVIIPPIITPPIPPIPEDPTDASRIDRVIIREYTQGIFYTDNFADASPTWKSSNNGLPTIPQSTEQIFVTGNKNLVVSYGYARLDISVDVNDGLWACAPGGTFQKILDYFTVASALGVDGTATIRLWVAVNGIDDTIAVVAQSTNKNEGTRKIFVGNSQGNWVTGVEITRKLEVVWPFTAVGYGDGQWQVISHELLDDYTFVYLISADGSTLTYDSGTTHANFVNTAPIVSIDAAKKFLLPLTNSAKLTDDNGTTFSNLAARPANYQGWLQALAINTAGDIYMWASDYPLSTDGGANWSEFAAFPGTPFYGSRFFYYGGSEWLGTIPSNTGGGVVSSLDDGVTWADKTGNLALITEISTFDIREIYGI